MTSFNEKRIWMPDIPLSITVGDTTVQGVGTMDHTIQFTPDNTWVWESLQPKEVEISMQGKYALESDAEMQYLITVEAPPVVIGQGEVYPTHLIHITEEMFRPFGLFPIDKDAVNIFTMRFSMWPDNAPEPVTGFIDFTASGITGDVVPGEASSINWETGDIQVWIPHPLAYDQYIKIYYTNMPTPPRPLEVAFPLPPRAGKSYFTWTVPKETQVVPGSVKVTAESIQGETMQISSKINGTCIGDVDKAGENIVKYDTQEIAVTFKEIVAPGTDVVLSYLTYQRVTRSVNADAKPVPATIRISWEKFSEIYNTINKAILGLETAHKYR